MLTISHGPSPKVPSSVSVTLPDFPTLARWLNANAECPPGQGAEHPWWSPAAFAPGSRKGQAPDWACLVLDCDGLMPALDGLEHVYYESRNSSPGAPRYRVAIALTEPLPAKYVPLVAATFDGADLKAALPTQVFFHRGKGSKAEYAAGEPFDWHVGLLEPAIKSSPVTLNSEPATSSPELGPEGCAAALKTIDPDLPYDEWCKVGMALHHEYGGSEAGFAAWRDWSSFGEKYIDEADCRSHWRSFTPGGGITGRTLLQMDKADLDDFPIVPIVVDDVPRAKLITAADLLRPHDAPPYLVDGLLEHGAECSLIGPSQSYKSLFALELGICVASGTSFFGHDAQQGLVMYLCGEGAGSLRHRAQALRKARNLDFSKAPFVVLPRPLALPKPEGVQLVKNYIAEAEKEFATKLTLLIIDTYGRYSSGEENAAEDLYAFFRAAGACRRDATLLVVHHTGHANATRGRGTSAWEQLVDTEFVAAKEDSGVRVISNTKQKDSEPTASMCFRLARGATDSSRVGRPVSSVVLEPTILRVEQ